jgi:hypothetical protein
MIDIAAIRERMPVISSDDCVIGIVSRVGPPLLVTSIKDGCGFDHLVLFDWIEEVGGSVFLNKSRVFLQTHCDNVMPDSGAAARALPDKEYREAA